MSKACIEKYIFRKKKNFQSEGPGVLRERRHKHPGDIPLLPDPLQDLPEGLRGLHGPEKAVERLRLGHQRRQEGRQPGRKGASEFGGGRKPLPDGVQVQTSLQVAN